MKNIREEQRVAPSRPPTGVDSEASTRSRVARSILEHGPSTASALAERLGLTAAAIRRHLDVLEDTGVLESAEQRVYGHRGRGRPARVFGLTEAGRATFYSAYDDLAITALQFLARTGGPDAVTRFAESRIADLETRFAALAEASPDATPAEALAEALSADGYVASSEPLPSGEQLCQHHCPVASVAGEFPQLCEAETAAFSRLLGVHVQRLATIAHGDGVCTTHVPRTAHVPRTSSPTETSLTSALTPRSNPSAPTQKRP